MKYIKILLIILFTIIISYILIKFKYTDFENFSFKDGTFDLLLIDTKLKYGDCDNGNCKIKLSGILNNILYYITEKNDIYILNTNGGVSKSKISSYEDEDITSVCFSDNFKYGFAIVKSAITKKNFIYYTINNGLNWDKLKIDESDKIYFNIKNNIIMNNILLKTNNDTKEAEKLSITTFLKEKKKLDGLDGNYEYKTQANIIEINLTENSKTFLNNIELSQTVSEPTYNFKVSEKYKIYEETNTDKDTITYKEIKKILNYNENYIYLLKESTNDETSFNYSINFYDQLVTTTNYIGDIKLYNNLLIANTDKDLILININPTNYAITETVKIFNFENDIKLYDIDLIFDDDGVLSSYDIFIVSNKNKLFKFNLNLNFKIKNFINNTYNIFSESYLVGIASNYSDDIRLYEDISLPSDITVINNLLINRKKKKGDSMIIIGNDIYLYKKTTDSTAADGWKGIQNYKIEKQEENMDTFLANDNDYTVDKIIFKGDNTLKHKIYTFKITEEKYVDILLVGGGGGGGYGGGGGGSGDAKILRNFKMGKGTYKIIVGSGGNGGFNDGSMGGGNNILSWAEEWKRRLLGNSLDTDDETKLLQKGGAGNSGNNTELLKLIEGGGDTYKRLLVIAGGGGGASYSSNVPRTPINGELGKSNYSSGGGGGAGISNSLNVGIGGLGNDISGNGGSGFYKNNKSYGGGGGGIGNILLRHDRSYDINDIKHGRSATETSIGDGGSGYILDSSTSFKIGENDLTISKGGNGGFFGELIPSDVYKFEDTGGGKGFSLHSKKNSDIVKTFIPGKGGDGGIIIEGNVDIKDTYLKRGENGSEGILIIVSSTKKYETEKSEEVSNDELLQLYGINERDLNEERKDYVKSYYDNFIEKINQKKLHLQDLDHLKKDNKLEHKNSFIKLENIKNMSEFGISSQNKKTINDPISDAYLPYTNTKYDDAIDAPEINNINFNIITLYKQLLIRQPTSKELKNNSRKIREGILDLKSLRRIIINSDEYTKIVKLQSNYINPELLYKSTKKLIIDKIADIYLKEKEEEAPKILLVPLKDIYHHFQYNDYLLRALLVNQNFNSFKNELIDNLDTSKSDILELLNNHFDMNELKSKANDIKRFDMYHKQESDVSIQPFEEDKYEEWLDKYGDLDSTIKDIKLEDLVLGDTYDYDRWNPNSLDKRFADTSGASISGMEFLAGRSTASSAISASDILAKFKSDNPHLSDYWDHSDEEDGDTFVDFKEYLRKNDNKLKEFKNLRKKMYSSEKFENFQTQINPTPFSSLDSETISYLDRIGNGGFDFVSSNDGNTNSVINIYSKSN